MLTILILSTAMSAANLTYNYRKHQAKVAQAAAKAARELARTLSHIRDRPVLSRRHSSGAASGGGASLNCSGTSVVEIAINEAGCNVPPPPPPRDSIRLSHESAVACVRRSTGTATPRCSFVGRVVHVGSIGVRIRSRSCAQQDREDAPIASRESRRSLRELGFDEQQLRRSSQRPPPPPL